MADMSNIRTDITPAQITVDNIDDFSALDSWNVSGVTDLSYAFHNASGTYNLPHWNIQSVTQKC